IFPATLPTMISTLKVNVGLSWVGVIVGEFLVSNNGLGYLIIYGFQVFDFTLVMLSLVIIAIFAALMYQVVEYIEKWLMKHTRSEERRVGKSVDLGGGRVVTKKRRIRRRNSSKTSG